MQSNTAASADEPAAEPETEPGVGSDTMEPAAEPEAAHVPKPPAEKPTAKGRGLQTQKAGNKLQPLAREDIITNEHGRDELVGHNVMPSVGGAGDLAMVKTEESKFVYVQHPVTNRLTRKQQTKFKQEQVRRGMSLVWLFGCTSAI